MPASEVFDLFMTEREWGVHKKIYDIQYSILLACFPLFSCGGGSSGSETANSSLSENESIFLARSVVVPEGGRCAQGGFQIKSGEDKNKDGELEDGEIFKEDIICNDVSILPDIPLVYGPPIFNLEQIFDGAKFTCESVEYDDNSTTCYGPLVNGLPFLNTYDDNPFCFRNGLGFMIGFKSFSSPETEVRKFYRWNFYPPSRLGWVLTEVPATEKPKQQNIYSKVICSRK